jgi:hypothetical protein
VITRTSGSAFPFEICQIPPALSRRDLLSVRFVPRKASSSHFLDMRSVISSIPNPLAFSKSITIFLSPSALILAEFFRMLATPSDRRGNKWLGVLAVTRSLEGVAPITVCFGHSRAVTQRKLRGL